MFRANRDCRSRPRTACAFIGARSGAIVLVLALAAQATAESDRWFESQSPRATVLSNMSPDAAARLEATVERAAGALAQITGSSNALRRVPVLFGEDEATARTLLPQYWEHRGARPAGAYWAGPYRDCVVVRTDGASNELLSRVLHEYTHVLIHQRAHDVQPWFDEGLSELLGSAVVGPTAVEVGRPPARHLQMLASRRSWIPISELVAMARVPDSSDKRRLEAFYAESWALVHYLTLADGATTVRLTPPTIDDPASLERQLAAYVEARRFRTLRFDMPPQAGSDARSDTVRQIPEAKAATLRAGCIAEGDRPEAAVPLLERALAADPADLGALETMGYVRFQTNQPIEAAHWFDRAIATGKAGHLSYYYRAVLTTVVPGEFSERDLLGLSIELSPSFAPAIDRLGWLEASVAGGEARGLELIGRSIELDPENVAYWIDLARLRLRVGQREGAVSAGEHARSLARSAPTRALVDAFFLDLGKNSKH